uniref:Uncharacterized protein LOC103446394 n=1 Tax=Rhizophora mucronata TaxID=61149 RepID=A0A2P2JF33_RHIMU
METNNRQSGVSPAKAVLLGALAPGVNVSVSVYVCGCVHLILGVTSKLKSCNLFVVSILGSDMDYVEIGLFDARCVPFYYAWSCLLFKRLLFDTSCCVSCSNHRHPILAS